jgi:hypothetical protein
VHDNSATTESHYPLRCLFCGVYEHAGHDSGHCPSCEGFFSEGFLRALRRMTRLPDALPASTFGAPVATRR